MKSKFRWMRQAADRVDLMDEILPGETVVEVIGQGRVLVEGHEGVLEYRDTGICIKVTFGILEIIGCNLKLSEMTRNKLTISGEVSCVNFVQRIGK